MKQILLSITLPLFAAHAVGYAQEAIECNNRMNVTPVVIMEQTDTTKTNDVSIEKTETEKKEIFTTVEKQPEFLTECRTHKVPVK